MKIKMTGDQYQTVQRVMTDDFMFNYCKLDKSYGNHLKEAVKNYNPGTQTLTMKDYDVRNLSQGLDIYFHKISNQKDIKCNEVVDVLDNALGEEMARQRNSANKKPGIAL
jgi:hypothetical protein